MNSTKSFSERHGLSDPKKVEKLQNKVISSLKDHVTYNPEAQKKAQYFTRILDRYVLVLLQSFFREMYLISFEFPDFDVI